MQDSASRQIIEIQHYNAFRFGDGRLAGISVFLENQEILSAWHPMQKLREIVGNHHLHLMSFSFEKLRHGQNGAYGITVRVDMAGQNEAFRRLNDSIKAFKKGIVLHNFTKSLQRYTFFPFDTYLII
jgi:hypothetical protein